MSVGRRLLFALLVLVLNAHTHKNCTTKNTDMGVGPPLFALLTHTQNTHNQTRTTKHATTTTQTDMSVGRRLLFALLVLALLLNIYAAAAAAAAVDGDELEIIDDDDELEMDDEANQLDDGTPLGAHADVTTTFAVAGATLKRVDMDSPMTLLIGVNNSGAAAFNLTNVQAFLTRGGVFVFNATAHSPTDIVEARTRTFWCELLSLSCTLFSSALL
jgi:hypothetical protein